MRPTGSRSATTDATNGQRNDGATGNGGSTGGPYHGTLNIKGFGGPGVNGISDKWLYINQIVRDNRLAVLAIQEAHLSEERVTNINALFAATLLVINSPDPERATGAKGVAFVLNKKLLGDRTVTTETIIEGRAMMLKYPWAPGKDIKILNVYAPNRETENAAYWERLKEWCDQAPTKKPDVVLGDFNMVESTMDRTPARNDAPVVTEALTRLLRSLNCSDSWRSAHPNERAYTFRQTNSDIQSRLDRIYLKNGLLPKAADWQVTGPGLHSDHQLVTISIANYHAPDLGKGRWAAPLSLLEDAKFLGTMRELAMKLQEDLNNAPVRSAESNPQTIFASFKSELLKAAKKRTKEWMPKLNKRIETLETQRRKDLANSVRPPLQKTGWKERRLANTGHD
ncbi:Endonuclease/exonuclease/phosphatase [Trametes maxima]|nr:Endonuclease/exonuclease/phosphatase [Trametes maxima]